MSTGEILHVTESSLGESCSIQVDVPMNQVHGHVSSFFRTYNSKSRLKVDALIGGYPASTFGFWEQPTKVNGCGICELGTSDQTCSHPFTLHPPAKEIACLLECRNLPDSAFWSVAEVEWKKQVKAIQKRVDEKEAKVTDLISEIYKYFGSAFGFQVVVLAADVVQVTFNGRCLDKFWWFLTLSVFATIVTIIGGTYKVGMIKTLWKALNNDKPRLSERKCLLTKLTTTEGPGFDLGPQKIPKPKFGILQENFYHTFILVSLVLIPVAFGCICGVLLRLICNTGQ